MHFQRAFTSGLRNWKGLFNYITKRLKKSMLGIFKLHENSKSLLTQITHLEQETEAAGGKGSVQCPPQNDGSVRVDNSGNQTLNPVFFIQAIIFLTVLLAKTNISLLTLQNSKLPGEMGVMEFSLVLVLFFKKSLKKKTVLKMINMAASKINSQLCQNQRYPLVLSAYVLHDV